MTLIKPEGDDGDSGSFIAGVEEQFKHAAQVFQNAALQLEKGDLVATVKVKDLAHEYRKVATLCYEERVRLAAKRRKQAGIVHEYALDFDAARDEIRGRLACLRAAARAREVSE